MIGNEHYKTPLVNSFSSFSMNQPTWDMVNGSSLIKSTMGPLMAPSAQEHLVYIYIYIYAPYKVIEMYGWKAPQV